MKKSYLYLLLILLSLQASAKDFVPIPELWTRVTDEVGILSEAETKSLITKTSALEQEKGSQVAVLIVSSTSPETIEQYSFRVAEQWKIGRKEIDDGVILIIAMEDRKMRVEVGYGLEGAIPDIMAHRIIDNIITPEFKYGNYYVGIDQGLDAIIGLIKSEELPYTVRGHESNTSPKSYYSLFVFVLIIIVQITTRAFKNNVIKIIVVLAAFTLGWIFVNFVGGLSFALIAFVFGFSSGGKNGNGGRRYYRGGSFGGGYGGSSFGGGSFGGGGFSGGGGSFGGGGASGSW